jgi:hypothetical protein
MLTEWDGERRQMTEWDGERRQRQRSATRLYPSRSIPLCPARDKADAQECCKLTGAGKKPVDDLKVYLKSATTIQLKE